MTAELPGWLIDPALAPVWLAVRERLERNGVEPRGTVLVSELDRAERHAIGGLLGRPVVRDAVRLDLAELEQLLLARAGLGGLVGVVATLTGPLTDRVAARSSQQAARQAPFVAVRSWLSEHPHAHRPWTEQWLAGVRTSGLLSRVADPAAAGQAVVHAADIAAVLTAGPTSVVVARNELAARHTGDAHALDDGALRSTLVLRALALSTGEPAPRLPAERRALWEAFGVRSDTVSSTVLTLGLRPASADPGARRLVAAADHGDPVHLTEWDLQRTDLKLDASTIVLVCENPRVLETAALLHGGSRAVVCTSGMPGTVAMHLLRRLHDAGAQLRYHGDFDWPGIAIADRLVRLVGCTPWLMTADVYRRAVRPDGTPLSGMPVEPSWDAALGEAMSELGVAVHEEAVLDDLMRAMDG